MLERSAAVAAATCLVLLVLGLHVAVWPRDQWGRLSRHQASFLRGGGGGAAGNVSALSAGRRSANRRSADGGGAPAANPVLQLLQQAQAAVQAGSLSSLNSSSSSLNSSATPGVALLHDSLFPPLGAVARGGGRRPRAWRDDCQPSAEALLAVANVQFAPQLRAGSQADARAAAESLRAELAARWTAAFAPLHPVATSKLKSAGGGCRSIRIPPLRALQQQDARSAANSSRSGSGGGGAAPPASTSLLLVLDAWQRLDAQVASLALSLFALWGYASLHGYDVHVYVHGGPALPRWQPVYFIKVPGVLHLLADWRYDAVLYTDWDVLTSPHSAPPLSLFLGEWPAAALLQQGEYNLCAGVSLWRRTADAEALLRAWWAMGAAGCCPSAQHDQSALKHLVAAALANASGDARLYGAREQRHFALPGGPLAARPDAEWATAVFTTESPPQRVDAYLRARPALQAARSPVGLVALEANAAAPLSPGRAARGARVALTSCLGIWWGCVPADTPALLMHLGHVYAVEWPAWLVPQLLAFMRDWVTVLSSMAAEVAPAAAAPAAEPAPP